MTVLLCLCLLVPLAFGALTLFEPSAERAYGYGVNEPSSSNGSFPAVVFLHGDGSCGDFGSADELLSYNGFGYAIAQYNDGNRTDAFALAAEQFVTILPLMPQTHRDAAGYRTWAPSGVLQVVQDADKRFNFDLKRIFLVGYSLGGRGAWNTVLKCVDAAMRLIPQLYPTLGCHRHRRWRDERRPARSGRACRSTRQ